MAARNRLVAAFVAQLLVLTLVSGPAWPAAAGVQAKPAAVPAQAPETAETDRGSSVEIELSLVESGSAVRVSINPVVGVDAATLRVELWAGDRSVATTDTPIGDLSAGKLARRDVAIGSLPAGDVGIVAEVRTGEASAGSKFLAVRTHHGQVVASGSLAQLDDAVLAADRAAGRLSEAAYQTALAERHRSTGFDMSKTKVTKAPAALAAGATVSGQATYTYKDNKAYPVRNAVVEVLAGGSSLAVGRANTGADGRFTISANVATGGGSYYVRLSSENPVGKVDSGYNALPFTVTSGVRLLNPGDSWSGVAIVAGGHTETSKAFALLDSVKTVGDYYSRTKRTGWRSTLRVFYPSGTPSSNTDSQTSDISIAGGETRCGRDWCTEDAFDWDVLAHEVGHVVANQGGFDDSPGGFHNICHDAWNESRAKPAALRLAWSEGWATFWGMVALREQGVPSGFPVAAGDIKYDDLSGPPHYTESDQDITYSMEERGYCEENEARGETSEMAVQLALWDFWDSAVDMGETANWTSADIFNRIFNARPTTFGAAYRALISGRGLADQSAAQTALSAQFIAPAGLQPPTGSVGGCPPRFAWSSGGSTGHPNELFSLRFRTTAGAAILTKHLSSVTAFTPDVVDWQRIAANGTVLADVGGVQTNAPISDELFSAPVRLTINNTGCSAAPNATLTNLWDSYGDSATCGSWSGADGTQSVKLPDGRRAWFFSDTYLGSPRERPGFYRSFLRNSIVMQDSNGFRTITGGNTCQERNTDLPFFERYAHTPVPGSQSGNWMWSGDAKVIGNNIVKFYYENAPQPPFWRETEARIATIPISSLGSASMKVSTKPVPSPASWGTHPVIWGTALHDFGGFTYIYGWGVVDSEMQKQLYVARVAPGDLANPAEWTYNTGNGANNWSTNPSAARPVNSGMYIEAGFSVAYINGAHWLLAHEPSLNGGRIVAHPASTPWGFSSSQIVLYTPPEGTRSAANLFKFYYEARIHPQLSSDPAKITFSYNVNTTAVSIGCRTLNDHDANIYRPRFVDVLTGAFVPSLAKAAAPPDSSVLQRAAALPPQDGRGVPRGLLPAPPRGVDVPDLVKAPTRGVQALAAAPDLNWYDQWSKPVMDNHACPKLDQTTQFNATLKPDGTVNMTWNNYGRDVWYWRSERDVSINQPFFRYPLWVDKSPTLAAPLYDGTGHGHTFEWFVTPFATGDADLDRDGDGRSDNEAADSNKVRLQVTMDLPNAPTNVRFTDRRADGSVLVKWGPTTYPSNKVYYWMKFCDLPIQSDRCLNNIGPFTPDQLSARVHVGPGNEWQVWVYSQNLAGYSTFSLPAVPE